MAIHPTALIGAAASIDPSAEIGAFTVVHDNVEIGARCVVGSHCELGVASDLSDGSPLVVGADALIRSHSVFYAGSSFGEGLVTGHRVTVREGTRAGLNFQIGTLGDIQGHCAIGDYVRFHSNVHVGQHTVIEDKNSLAGKSPQR